MDTMSFAAKFGAGSWRPGEVLGRPISRAFYPSLLPSRIRCNFLKTKSRRASYPSLKSGGLMARVTKGF